MLKVSTERRRQDGCPDIQVSSKTAFHMTSEKVEAGAISATRPKHRNSCSTVEDDFAAPTVVDGLCPPRYRCSPQLRRHQQGIPRSGLSR